MITANQFIRCLTDNSYVGRRNSITARNLSIHFGISDGRAEVEMRNVIRNAINQEYLIGSCNRGFYMIDSLDEIECNLNSLKSRAENILLRRRNLLRNWNNIPNQQNRTALQDLEIRDI